MIVSRQQDVQLRSYLIWEREGRPQGRDWDHWFRAEAELAREQMGLKKTVASAPPQIRGAQPGKGKAAKRPAAKKT